MEWIIYLGAMGALLQFVPQWMWALEKFKLDRKPLNCPLCFTWWSSLIGLGLFTNTPWWECIFIAGGAAVLAELLWRKLMTI